MAADDPIVVWHEHSVSREDRERFNGHRGCVVWFTGLSGSGKSTVANAVDQLLYARNVRSFLLDGDNVRHGLNATPEMLAELYGQEFGQRFGLGFSQQDREENIRRVGAVAGLLSSAGLVTLTAFVSPFRSDRDLVRQSLPAGDFIEVFVDASVETCESRDPKGLYKKARAGEISNFTGISSPYEPPLNADLVLDANQLSPPQLAEQVVESLVRLGKIS
jgi:adenylylsulfate kinase